MLDLLKKESNFSLILKISNFFKDTPDGKQTTFLISLITPFTPYLSNFRKIFCKYKGCQIGLASIFLLNKKLIRLALKSLSELIFIKLSQ